MPHADKSAVGAAARAKLAEALHAVGAGQTVALELFVAAAEAELRQLWGTKCESEVAGKRNRTRTRATFSNTETEAQTLRKQYGTP